jgi:energy-coupling factor transport system permease protein
MMQSVYYESNSILHRLNPLSKVIATVPLFILLNLVNDLWMPLALLLPNIALLLFLSKIPLLHLLRMLRPFLLILVGFLICYALFIDSKLVAGSPVLFSIGMLQIRVAGVLAGLTTCLRVLSLLVIMLTFVLTTDATSFVQALVQQWHVSYRLGYGAMAAYRFIPLVESESRIIRAAQKVRGVPSGWQLEHIRRSAIPLLASAIRRAEQMALAMDARAFGSQEQRTYYHRLRFTRTDWLFITAYWLVSGTIVGLVLLI